MITLRKYQSRQCLLLVCLALIGLFSPLLVCQSQAAGLIEKRSYSILLPEKNRTQVSVYSSTSGPIIMLDNGSTQELHDGRSGNSLTDGVRSEDITRGLGFVSKRDVSPFLSSIGCENISPGCTSPQDADFVIKITETDEDNRSLRIEYYGLSSLKELFFAALRGEKTVHFEAPERQVIEDLVTGTWAGNSWRENTIASVLAIQSLEAASRSKVTLRQFRFASDPSLLPRIRFGETVIRETLLDKIDQLSCRLLAAGIVKAYPAKHDAAWLSLAMQEGMLNLCTGHSVQFRFGLFDSDKASRNLLSKGLKKLACDTHSQDYWCTALSLEGNSCQERPLDCGNSPAPFVNVAPNRSSPERSPKTTDIDITAQKLAEWEKLKNKDYFSIFEFKETQVGLSRDTRAIGIAFNAVPVDIAQNGEFHLEISPNSLGKSLMKLNSYKVSVTVLVEITRLDECTNNKLACVFNASGKVARRTERFTRYVTLPSDNQKVVISLGKLAPLNDLGALKSTLKSVRMIIDKVTVDLN